MREIQVHSHYIHLFKCGFKAYQWAEACSFLNGTHTLINEATWVKIPGVKA